MVDLTITSAQGTVKCTIDMINPDIDQNFTVMEYEPQASDATDDEVKNHDLISNHMQRKTETNKTELYNLAVANNWDVTFRNQANGATGTWFNEFSGSVSVSASI